MKVLIVEDEAPAYRRLIKLISECDNTIEIAGVIQSVKDGIEWFTNNPLPDLILSDIQLADDLSFTIYREQKITVPIIFITAYDEYAMNAFKFYSIDYLLKPVSSEDIKASLDKYKTIHKSNFTGSFDELLQRLSEKSYRERFLVYHGDNLIPLSVNDIAFFTSNEGTTILITHENKRYFLSETLDALENELDPRIFYRANRQFIISLNSIEKIFSYGQQKLKVIIQPIADESIIISKSKATLFKKWLNK